MEVKPVKIFTAANMPRLRFIADLILNEILGLSWEIVTDKRKLGKCPVINYSAEKINGSFKINPCTLLFEAGVMTQEITVEEWKGLPVFFTSQKDADIPFDIFAASFYLVSRYEEYLNFEPDEFGRFKSAGSLAFKYGFLGMPIVDLWAKELAKSLVKKFQTLTFKRNAFSSLVTFDVDEPFAFLGKSLLGNIGGLINDFTKEPKSAGHRLSCLKGGEKDPYEIFDYLIKSCSESKADSKFFFPVGNQSAFDKNPSWKNEQYRNLIKRISLTNPVGIHPSYKASMSFSALKTELQRINSILGGTCSMGRFHFLKIAMPESYRNIDKAGISEDYSMGYHDEPGFRAGIARPYRFYDLLEDKVGNLRIFPFQVMDMALINSRKYDAGGAKDVISQLILQTKSVGGLFISIWHNTSLLENDDCSQWRDVFEFTLNEQIP